MNAFPNRARPTRVARTILVLAAAWVAGAAAPARAGFTPQFHPTLHLTRAPGPIRIDGDLDDPGWKGAAVARGLAEVAPGDQVEPPVESEAWVTYDEHNLYFAFIARDDPATVRVGLRERDHIFSDDYFGVMFDTYGKQAWGYELFVNPIGIQGDLRVLTDGTEELAFDIVWESRGKVTEDGYQVEIAVPFASLRFPDRPVQEWRINFWRDHQRDLRRQYAWAAINRDDSCWMCQWGTLTGIENITPGKNLELIATGIGRQTGAMTDDHDPASRFANDNGDADGALNVRYGLASNASTEVALNPDFSQVESDAGQIDVNSTFALFYPEKRPFFQEGSDQYNTWISAIYTRSINDPLAAGKFSGQYDKTNVTYTVARDEHSPLILPFEEQSRFVPLGKSVSNIVRARQTLYQDAYVGALVTDRRVDAGGSGTVFAADANLRLRQDLRFKFQGAFSHTTEPTGYEVSLSGDPDSVDTFDGGLHTVNLDGESYWGKAIYAGLERGGRSWNAEFEYYDYSPTFRTDNGFTTRNDYRQTSFWAGPYLRPNRPWLTIWEPSVAVGRVWNTAGRFKDEWVEPHLTFQLTGQTRVAGSYLWSSERFSEVLFHNIKRGSIQISTHPNEVVSVDVNATRGTGIYRNFDAPELGNQLNVSASGEVKLTQRLTLEPSWDYAQMRSRRDDRMLFKTYILRTRLNLNFTREWFLRLVVQYDDRERRLDLEPLLTYRVNPFTVFYVGVNGRYRNFLPGTPPVPGANPGSDWKLASRQFFAKVQYLIRI